MSRSNISLAKKTAALLLCLSFFTGWAASPAARAQDGVSKGGAKGAARARSSVRGKKTARLDKISSDLREMLSRTENLTREVRVICQFNREPGAYVQQLYTLPGVSVSYSFANSIDLVATMPASVARDLSLAPEIDYISLDREVRTLGHVSATAGADAVRRLVSPGLDGTGIGIAVLDSGIDDSHKAFRDGRTDSSTRRIVFERSFVGTPGNYADETKDPFGHGTHVASLAAGNGRVASGSYIGVAPNASIINLRVLDSEGRGTVSSVLQALDWLLSNHRTYNIRVVNMSLGMPAIDSYRVDPVCVAVRKLVDAGIVVVAAAGNNGKDAEGRKVYGQIHSPGIEPAAITVGATNTYGTDSRSDDAVASYSSRGPTRSHTLDARGARLTTT